MTEVSTTIIAVSANDTKRHPRVLVVTSCTGEKRFSPENQLTLEDFKNTFRLQMREKELANTSCTAGQMYTGLQHLRAMEGVAILRQSFGQETVDVAILSAGYGLIPEDKLIVPYEVTFNPMKGYEIDEWANFLNVHHAFEKAIQDYDLVFMLLGEKYLRSLLLPIEMPPHQTFIILASQGSLKYIRGLFVKNFIFPLSNTEAKRYRYGSVGLKGFLFKQFAEAAARQPELLLGVYQKPENFKQVINKQPVQLELPLDILKAPIQVAVKATQSKLSDKIDFLSIPDDIPPAPNRHLGMQYFIPEWDDRIDPHYQFLTDTFTPHRLNSYNDELYSHQIYNTPNYDGILVSKVVVDKSKKKNTYIQEAGGIHNFIRFQGQVMGDCGAFGYIQEDVPPYKTEEILDYYERLGFNYGVSIDHLIVGPFAEDAKTRKKRYDLTLKNAEDFISKHQAKKYNFIPIGAAQGWSPESYAKAVKEIINMGYEYIALGGLARAISKNIIEILIAIQPHLTSNIRLHLFGVGRIDAIPIFRHLGVTSFDSSSSLRSAWLDPMSNYHVFSKNDIIQYFF